MPVHRKGHLYAFIVTSKYFHLYTENPIVSCTVNKYRAAGYSRRKNVFFCKYRTRHGIGDCDVVAFIFKDNIIIIIIDDNIRYGQDSSFVP
ncbi:wsv218 [White spot syndrome virus]|uniref:Wsv218 n=3 Tax=White spot syndrome virus TaxID=342409 RepID=Q8VAZ7_WSSVS|nr:wsv218 [Shrimp white spot syndrome virus]AFX59595.1 wsv218 [White spot syndrome virus]AAL33222.1 wsv218 [Shrimp white spot syndrome virus]AAL89141.1 WSSV273 [Shrimp white spot syndrome virus]AWQ61220.1 wsv218 [Shrimp white spot syndrome virus]AWQ62115.1 wsv218 [Shrimp white spot syndrome virus]